MIERSQMFTPLLEADPSFEQSWTKFVYEYANEVEPPLYIALSDLADHLIQRLRRSDARGFEKVFEVVERWLLEGEPYVREAASLGFLESLQNYLGGNDRTFSAEGVKASDFEPFLGCETRRWWEKLYRFWGGDTAALRADT